MCAARPCHCGSVLFRPVAFIQDHVDRCGASFNGKPPSGASRHAGVAVSGEITLHSDWLYIQVSQSVMGSNCGILFRSCDGRRDYVGGVNNFAPLDLLHQPEQLVRRIKPAGLA